jgi:hypothetical protein
MGLAEFHQAPTNNVVACGTKIAPKRVLKLNEEKK